MAAILPDDGKRVLGVGHDGNRDGLQRERHAAVAVPGPEPPAFGAAQGRQVVGGFREVVGLDPEAGEAV